KRGAWRRRPWVRRALFVLALVAIVATILAAVGIRRLSEIGSTISTQGAFTTQTGYMTGANRVNLLVLGFGGTGHDGAYLTDSMMVISVVPDTGATSMISVPRDLWVQVPPGSGSYGKLNTAFNDGMQHGFGGYGPGRAAGGAEAANKVSEILGISVPYWVTIDFSGFRDLVNALGGVDITVPVAFTANYPANDDPAVNASWKTIHFKAGPQHMDGERAIEYARARYVTTPISEASDFARSARQQLLIRAILGKARQVGAWPGLNQAADALGKTMYSDLSLLDLGLFAQHMDTNHAARIGLSDQNVLVDAQSSDGQEILQPANGDWGAIPRYVQKNLKS
ncbi:MAG TPA: LCP family protein, partial [Ktedonobacterales bacterium]